jgi:hypothetical protein
VAKFFEHNAPFLPLNDEIFFYDLNTCKFDVSAQKYVVATELDNFVDIDVSIAVGYSNKFGYSFYGGKELHRLLNTANSHSQIVGFHSKDFADLVLGAKGIMLKTDYDLLREIRIAAGQAPDYVQGYSTHGYGLDFLAYANLNFNYDPGGLIAPYLYRPGMEGQLITHCLTKVKIIIWLYLNKHKLIHPNNNDILRCRATKWDDPNPFWLA